ncbi:MAG TPA: hypothetical protein VL400_06480 [Polyangiaceae bacterium]|nr:hypothetical protein [Polyangiaceae bacterium]
MQHSFATSLAFASVLAACGGEVPVDTTSTSSTSGSGGGATTTSSSGGGGTGGSTGSFTSTGGSGTGGAVGSGGAGGAGGGEPWPTCDTQPAGSPTKTLSEIWADDPAFPTAAWVPGVYVTAVSGNGCVPNQACQFFVQQDESYADLAAATHQSLRVGITPAVAHYFTDIAVGDRVDLYANAFRDTQNGKNELNFLVGQSLPGCAKVVGSGDPQPFTITLDELSVQAYEVDRGPLLVRLETVTGNPNMPAETFALWDTGTAPSGDITTVTSLSPFFLPGATFNGLTDGTNTDFGEVVGVFGIFAPPAVPLIKYEEIYVRSDADYPKL